MTFGGHDPSSGAGIQADALTVHALSCHPVTVVTAVTVQNSQGVLDYQLITPQHIFDQAKALLNDMDIAVIKTGMLGNDEAVKVVGEISKSLPGIPLIVDPVLASNTGQSLSTDELVPALHEHLLPGATLTTPNVDECRILGRSRSIESCVNAILKLGCRNILVTGTHDSETADVEHTLFMAGGRSYRSSYPRLQGEYHGSGCTLAAAVSAFVARGFSVDRAVASALDYTWQTIKQAYKVGYGQFIPQRSVCSED